MVLQDHWVPATLEIATGGDGEPETYAKVAVSQSGAKLVELRFVSTDSDSRGVRQQDLRDVEVKSLLEDFVAMFTFRVESYPEGGGLVHPPIDDAFDQALRFVSRLRSNGTRDITPQLLERVAEIYRANISRYPTKAVQHHFQVSQRMAAEYVSRARQRGLLPPTKKGRKLA